MIAENAVKEREHTPDMKLPGEKQAKQKNLAGDIIADKPDPLVVERAKDYAKALDNIEVWKDRAEKQYATLQEAFKKSKRSRKVTITTEWNVWSFWAESTWKVKKKRETPVK